jgi:hypothetical protein
VKETKKILHEAMAESSFFSYFSGRLEFTTLAEKWRVSGLCEQSDVTVMV